MKTYVIKNMDLCIFVKFIENKIASFLTPEC